MDANVLTALAALSGSAIGGAASFFSSWLGHGAQHRAQLFLHHKGQRQQLYREFIEEASASYVDAVTGSTPDLSRAVHLYALVSRMRVLSSPAVIDSAHQITRLIIESYAQPNITILELQKRANETMLDPLRSFAEACRQELDD